jgi:hypothetical protein
MVFLALTPTILRKLWGLGKGALFPSQIIQLAAPAPLKGHSPHVQGHVSASILDNPFKEFMLIIG